LSSLVRRAGFISPSIAPPCILAETRGVPELRAEVAAEFHVLLVEQNILPERGAAHHAEAQRVGAELRDEIERVRRIAERLRHFAALLVADDAGEIDIVKREFTHEFETAHDHSGDP